MNCKNKKQAQKNLFRSSLRSGFTLIELMVVVLIIGILSAIALPQYQRSVEHARAAEALTLMSAISDSVQRYHAQHEEWPTNFSKLDVDIPTNASCSSNYGGKHFCITLNNNNNDKVFIMATRKRGTNNIYLLQTTVIENNNGTYSTVLSCMPYPSTDPRSPGYCNVITGGSSNLS